MRMFKNLCIAWALLGLSAATTTHSWAVDGKWNVNAAGNWSTASNWTNNQVPGGVGSIANIEFNIGAARTVTVDIPVTVGRIRFNDTTSTFYDWTLNSANSSVLTLEVAPGGVPIIDINRQTVTFNTPLAGTQGFRKIGGGTLALTSAANATGLSGKVIITNGIVRITGEDRLGAYPASYVADQITLTTGGALMNNTSEVTLNANNGITLGAGGGGIQAGWGRFFTVNSIITGPGGLTFRSDATPGAMTLTADNTYTGPTVIGNSTANNSWALVVIDGSLHASSAVSVNANGALTGNGTVNGAVTVNANGIVSPGSLLKAGTLTVNNNVLATNSFLMVDLGAATTVGGGVNDLLQVNGDLTLQGTVTVSINATAGSLASGTYRLINYTGNGTFTGATLVCDNPNLGATFDTSTPGQVNMTIANGTPVNITWTGTAGIYWDIAASANFQKEGTPVVFNQGDSVTFDDTGVYTDPVTMLAVGPNFGMVQPSAVYVNTTNNVTLTSSGTARLGGSASVYKGGSGTLTMTYASDNLWNNYGGVTVVTNGTLKPGKSWAFGSTNAGTYISNGGTLDVNAINLGFEPFFVEGTGVNGAGALINTAGAQNNALRVVTMTGNTTVGGTGRFDIRSPAGDALLNTGGNPYKLTKVGANQISLVGVQTDPALGEVDVLDGTFGFETTSTLGDATKNITIAFDASLLFWNLSNGFYKPMILNGGTLRHNVNNGSGDNTIIGPVSLNAQTLWNVAAGTLKVDSGITGVGGLTKLGANTLTLNGTNTYAGPTYLNGGTLILGPTAGLPNTSLIAVTNGATLDVSQVATGLTLGSGQALSGAGTVAGGVNAGPGSTLIPGTSPGTLTISGPLGITNATLDFELGSDPLAPTSDQITALGVTAGGVNTIKIRPLAALSTANPYNLIANFGLPMASGTETNFSVTSDSRYSFSIVPTDTSSGVNLQVQVSGTPAASLKWQGNDAGNPTLWDLKTTANWLNGATADTFFGGDTVTFDDSAIGTTVSLVGKLEPSAVVFNNVNKAFTLNGAGSLVTPSLSINGTGTATLANEAANQFVFGITNNGGTLVIANAAANDYGPVLTLNSGTMVMDQTLDVTVSTPLAGGGTLRKENTNTLTLSGISTGVNPITVNNGILRPGHYAAFGDPATPLTIGAGGTLNVNGINLTNKVIKAAGAGYNGAGAIVNTGAGAAWSMQNLVLTGDTVFGGPNVWDLRYAFAGIPASLTTEGGVPCNITKIGSQRFSIVGADVGQGIADIDIQGGVFSYEEFTGGLGNPAYTITVRSNAFLTFYRSVVALDKRIVLENAATIRAADGTSNHIAGPVFLAGGEAKLGAADSDALYLFGPISGPGGLRKVEVASVHLVASNSFEGDVVVEYGNLVLSNSYALGTNKTVLVDYNTLVSAGAGTRLYLRGGITTPEDVTGTFTSLSGSGLDYRTSLTGDSLTNTWAGPLVLEGSGIVGFYSGASTNILNITGPILGTNGFSGTAFFRGSAGFGGTISGKFDMPTGVLALTDNTTWRIENPANVWRQTTIAYGRIILGADNAVCSTAPLVLGQTGTSTGWLDLNGFNQTVPSLTTVNGANHFITNGNATANSMFTFDGGTNISTLNGRILDNGVGKLSLTVSSGSLTLLGNNTYLGNTVISGGTLALGSAGTLASTPLITLASGAVLDTSAKGAAGLTLAASQKLEGSGTVDGSLTVGSTATLSPAASAIGAIAITNVLTCAAGGTLLVDVNSTATPACDVVNAASVVYGGTLSLNNAGPAFAVGNSFKLFNAATYGGAFAAIVPATPGEGLAWDTSTLGVDGTLKVKLAVSTEPTSITMEMTAGGFDLSWPSTHIGWRLETQTNPRTTGLSNNWTTVPGSTTTNKVSITYENTETTVFFRLVYP